LAVDAFTHGAINTGRELIGRSQAGKKFMAQQLEQGLAGRPMSSMRETAFNLGMSPAALDPYRVGRAVSTASPEAGQFVKERPGIATQAVQAIPNLRQRFSQALSSLQPAPQPVPAVV
jgi:hypothetical protein